MWNIVVLRVQRTKPDSESFVTAYQFVRYSSVVFKKNISAKDRIYPFCLSICFGRKIFFEKSLPVVLLHVQINLRANKSAIENKIMSNQQLAEKLRKPIIGKFEKRKVHWCFKDKIWDADLADIQLIETGFEPTNT